LTFPKASVKCTQLSDWMQKGKIRWRKGGHMQSGTLMRLAYGVEK